MGSGRVDCNASGGNKNDMLLITLSVLAGVCLYAAIHHLWIARYLSDRTHLLFALLCLMVTFYVLAKTGAYRAVTAAELVSRRRWEISLGCAIFGLLPWFVRAYTGLPWRVIPAVLTVLMSLFFAVNLITPYGFSFVEFPTLQTITLPWGEQMADLRPRRDDVWYNAMWAAILLNFMFAGYACLRQYWHGEQRRAIVLALALAVLLGSTLFNWVVNQGLVNFVHTAEFGFIALVLLMSAALSEELRRSGRAHVASEARFRTLVEQSPFSIQVLAPDGRTRLVNRAWEQLWGVKLTAMPDYNLLHDQQLVAKDILPYLERAFRGEAVEIPPVVYKPKNTLEISGGPYRDRWVRAYAYPIHDDAQRVREVILMHEDITAHKRAEDALRHIATGVSAQTGEAFFRDLVTYLAALFGAKYAFLGLLDENDPMLVNTLAVSVDGAIADNLSYRLDDTPCANVVGQTTCAHASGVQQLFPKDILLQQMGVDSYIGTPLFDTHGTPLGLIVILDNKPMEHLEQVREILQIFAARAGAELERVRAEADLARYREHLEHLVAERTVQLEVTNKELEAFSHSVSHDLRAPLRAINGFSQALIEDYAVKLDATALDYLNRVRQGALRMDELINDLLKLSRVTRQGLRGQNVNLSALTAECAAELHAHEPQREVEWLLAPHVLVVGDPQLLRIAMDNLLGNAWKYTSRKPHARIEFGVLPGDGPAVYFVRDNGAGFDMQHADRLFGAFQRLHKAEDFPGTGIGLATVQRIVTRHGGCIWAESQPEQGATFYFTLTTL